MESESITVSGKPRPLTRWWLKARPSKNATQLNPLDASPVIELFVPWYAWPFELLHRAVFGRAILR